MINVVIVDDHALFRLGTRAALSLPSAGINVLFEADNGVRLFRRLKKNQLPQMLLLDIIMPEMSGLEVAIKMREQYPTVKLLMLSSESDATVIMQLLDVGVDGFVSKSAPQAELIEAIHAVANGENYFGSNVSDIIKKVHISQNSSTLSSLTLREQEILNLIVHGNSVKEISAHLCLSPRTVETHKSNIYRKMGFCSLIDLVRYAVNQGLIPL